VTPGVKRLLMKVLKWVIVPVLLLLVGYLWVGPYVLPKVAGKFLPRIDTDDRLPGEPAPEPKEQ
jgi:TM2 domain-containing membrane protein YozV